MPRPTFIHGPYIQQIHYLYANMCRNIIDYVLRILKKAHYLDIRSVGSLGNIGVYIEFNNVVDVLVSAGFFYHCAFPVKNSLNIVEVNHDLVHLLISYLPFNREVLQKRRVLVLANPQCIRENISLVFFKRVKTLMLNKYNSEELVICKTDFGEDFYSFLASFFLKQQGYIVFPEGTLDHLVNFYGIPDIVVAKLGDFQEKLVKKNVINCGTIITELNLKIFSQEESTIKSRCNIDSNIGERYFVAIEVEPSSDRASGGRGQAEKYVMSRYFKYGMLICPGREDDEKYYPDLGLITWREDGSILYYEPKNLDKADHSKADMLARVTKKLLTYMILRNTPLNILANRYHGRSLNDIIEGMDPEIVLD